MFNSVGDPHPGFSNLWLPDKPSQGTLSKTFLQRRIVFWGIDQTSGACIVNHRENGRKEGVKRAKVGKLTKHPSEHLMIAPWEKRKKDGLIRTNCNTTSVLGSFLLFARIDNWCVHPCSAVCGVIILPIRSQETLRVTSFAARCVITH